MKKSQNVLLSSRRDVDFLRPLRLLINEYNYSKARSNLKQYPQLAIFAFDHIGLSINAEGRFEDRSLCLVRELVRQLIPDSRNQVALDIGANIGNHSIFFSEFFSEVIAFEPNPRTFALLETNCRFLSVSQNISVKNYGLSNQSAELYFKVDGSNIGGGAIVNEGLDSSQEEMFRVEVKKADDILELHQKQIAVVKIDIEGHELQALEGAREILLRNRPLVLFEQLPNEISNGTSPTIDYLRSLDYGFASIEQSFDFPPGAIQRWLSLVLKTLFGTRLKIIETDSFKKKYYEMIIAIPNGKK
jgi:FkbM family methyltransferase